MLLARFKKPCGVASQSRPAKLPDPAPFPSPLGFPASHCPTPGRPARIITPSWLPTSHIVRWRASPSVPPSQRPLFTLVVLICAPLPAHSRHRVPGFLLPHVDPTLRFGPNSASIARWLPSSLPSGAACSWRCTYSEAYREPRAPHSVSTRAISWVVRRPGCMHLPAWVLTLPLIPRMVQLDLCLASHGLGLGTNPPRPPSYPKFWRFSYDARASVPQCQENHMGERQQSWKETTLAVSPRKRATASAEVKKQKHVPSHPPLTEIQLIPPVMRISALSSASSETCNQDAIGAALAFFFFSFFFSFSF